MKTQNMWSVVARREIVTKATDKTFIISTVVTMLLLVAGFFFLAYASGRNNETKIGVTSADGQILVDTVNLSKDKKWQTVNYPDAAAARSAVENGDVDLAVIKEEKGWRALVTTVDQTNSDLLSQVNTATYNAALVARARDAGIDVENLLTGNELSVTSTNNDESDTQNQIVLLVTGLIFAIAFFMMSLVFGLQIAGSVVKEKESRVVEILSAAIPHSQLLLGKVVGNAALAFSQVLLYVAVAVAGVSFTQYSALIPQFTTGIGWFLAFFVSGFLALSCLWAAAGAMATQYEEVQQTSLPINILLIAGYVVAFIPGTTFKAVLSYAPIMSSILMPTRLMDGSAAWWQGIIALALNFVFMAFAIRVGAKLYRSGVLQTGRSLTWSGAFTKAS